MNGIGEDRPHYLVLPNSQEQVPCRVESSGRLLGFGREEANPMSIRELIYILAGSLEMKGRHLCKHRHYGVEESQW